MRWYTFCRLADDVHGRQAQRRLRRERLLALVLARLQGLDAHGLSAQLDREGLGEGAVDDGEHIVKLFRQVIEENGIRGAASFVRRERRLNGEILDELGQFSVSLARHAPLD
jgi:hypothetical protein